MEMYATIVSNASILKRYTNKSPPL